MPLTIYPTNMLESIVNMSPLIFALSMERSRTKDLITGRFASTMVPAKATWNRTKSKLTDTGNQEYSIVALTSPDFVVSYRHPGCKCGSEFSGRHCELVGASSRSSADSSDNKGYIIGLSVGITVLAVALVASIMYRRRRRRQLHEMPPYISHYSDEPPTSAPAPTIDHINGTALADNKSQNLDGTDFLDQDDVLSRAPSNTPSGTSNGDQSNGSATFAEDKETGVASLMKEEPSNTSPADMPMGGNTPEGSEVTVFHDSDLYHV